MYLSVPTTKLGSLVTLDQESLIVWSPQVVSGTPEPPGTDGLEH